MTTDKMNAILINKLSMLLEKKNINKRQLARKSGIPHTTIIGFYEHGMADMKFSTLMKLADYFEVPLNYFDVDPVKVDEVLLKAILDKVRGNDVMLQKIWHCITLSEED